MADRLTRTKRWPVTADDLLRALRVGSADAYLDVQGDDKRWVVVDGTFDLEAAARALNVGTL